MPIGFKIILASMKVIITAFCILSALFGASQPGTKFPEGKPGIDFNKVNSKGKRDGLWVQQWKDTRNLLYKGDYKNGVPVGDWERFYPDGHLMANMKYVQDTTVVEATFFHPDGTTVMTSGTFIKKKKEGNWKLWNADGMLVSDEVYKDSLLEGTCKYFYPNGKTLKVEEYKSGVKHGPFTEFYESGKKKSEGAYFKDEKDGPYKAWFSSGNLDCEGKYYRGTQDGNWYYNHEDGAPKLSILYNKGAEVKRKYSNGTIKEYYDSSIPKSEYSYEDGMKNGPFTEWYDQGQYVQVPGTKEDIEAGIVYREKLDGTQIRVHGDYVDDKLEGEVIYYRSNGSVDRIEEWSDGKLIKTRQASK